MNAGMGIGLTNFELKDISANKIYNRNYSNFFPSASLKYTYKSNNNFNFNYSGITTQPTIDQLQPLTNNNDQINQYIGNPALKPSFNNNFNISHQSYNFITDVWVYESLNISLKQNAITNNTRFDNSGKSVTQPINTNGNVSINFWSGGGFKIKKIDTRVNVSPTFGYNRFADFIDGKKTFSTNSNMGLSVGLSKQKEKKYDFSIYNEFASNATKTLGNNNSIHYITNTLNANAIIYYKKVWSIINEYRFYTRQKTAQVPSLSKAS